MIFVLKMEERHFKILVALFIFFILDIIKPLGYSFCGEFLFLGIIFLALNFSPFVSFNLSILAGYVKDCLTSYDIPLNIIEFPVICIFIYYFLLHFRKAKVVAVICALVIHIILYTLQVEIFDLHFLSLFFIHSCVFFLLINYLLRKWLKILHESYI